MFLKLLPGEFPGDPVIRMVGSHWQDLRSVPDQGINILHILHAAKKRKKKKLPSGHKVWRKVLYCSVAEMTVCCLWGMLPGLGDWPFPWQRQEVGF